MKAKRNIQSMYQKKTFKRPVDLLLIGKESKRHYVLIKDLNKFRYDQTLPRGSKHFLGYFLQAFTRGGILKDFVCLL